MSIQHLIIQFNGSRTVRRKLSKTILFPCAFLLVFLSLQGCGGVVIGAVGAGVGTGAAVAHDRRTAGTFVDDQIIELKAINHLRTDKDLWEQSHISPTSFNNIVLLSGEIPNEFLRERAAGLIRQIPEIREIHNELAVAAPSSTLARTSDSVVTGKVKAKLITDERIDAMRIKVVTERGIVYLMGLVTRQEADLVTEIVRRVGGVQRVIRLFEYI
uniref:Osmotically-inducible protein OsmY, contains BON domain n=1 Tax=Candidatus Kentrum eta TaxID=2126337 RepID=A0A450UAH9_9GAMM|nr:MAG: Osmotically-inducible protein OsmY, contains BON domain [Candidatus Kentron sp. H]VFJ91220.1 MAG: Osmotically-inducible protein OsmY, contains BON domain [Candidatus Kentron sp. H]VFJ97724.1 MAG: Osmotically-inducible protein OsmY, contains BON domain [Candidatus Kentron sp. H]